MSDNPLKRLDDLAKQTRLESEAEELVETARARLILGSDARSAFFGSLAMRWRLEASWELETCATDGRRLVFNPEFMSGLSMDAAIAVLCHEVMHCSMGHERRKQWRDHPRWNIAADIEINPIIRDAGYRLPSCALYPRNYRLQDGECGEWYYDQLPDDGGDGEGEGDDPGGCGGFIPAEDNAQQQEIDAEWQVAVAQASNLAQQRGEMPGALGRLIDKILHPAVPWQDVLRDFVSRSCSARDDYTWRRPNRRFIGQGLYLPGLYSESIGDLVVALDTSGSVGPQELAEFSAELSGIMEASPATVTVICCDHAIQSVERWNPGDVLTEAKGGGGTSHVPLWDYLREQDSEPAAVICLTDGYTNWGEAPDVPVLWALTKGSTAQPPFGRVLQLN